MSFAIFGASEPVARCYTQPLFFRGEARTVQIVQLER